MILRYLRKNIQNWAQGFFIIKFKDKNIKELLHK